MLRIFESPTLLYRTPATKETEYVLTIGNFDGIHRGHLKILRYLNELKGKSGAQSLIYSFREHPRHLLQQVNVPRILSQEDKLHILKREGIDAIILRNFWEIFNLSWEEFWETELSFLNITDVVIGFNFRFGKEAAGHLRELQTLGSVYNFKVHIIEPLEINGEIISSTLIRKYIQNGNFEKVTNYLGRPYKIDGIVVPGDKIGHRLGYPTANLQVTRELLPRPGIYAATVHYQGQEYLAACYSGICPTIENKRHVPHIEVHILNFSENIYNELLEVDFHSFIREDQYFSSLDSLKEQIGKDIEDIAHYFRRKK